MANKKNILYAGSLLPVLGLIPSCAEQPQQKPNILFCIADDQSYPYTSFYGSKCVNTPGFDYIASHGAAFANAYSTSPGSSPSRASILTGMYPWQIAEAGTHASCFSSNYVCYPDVFAAAGYQIGHTGKGWAPGDWKVSGRPYNPAGPMWNDILCEPPYSGISSIDYSANFAAFLDENEKGQPFCFWLGGHEPHRPYEEGSWEKEEKSLSDAEVPAFLPDADEVRGDILDYAVEINWFDSHVMKCINELKKRKMLDNTIIIITADNGMSFPHAKANCYDAGIHVPLAICWGNHISKHDVRQTIVSLVDIFPTLLDLTGTEWGAKSVCVGESLAPLLGLSDGQYSSKEVFSGRERHSCSRYGNRGYSMRSIRYGQYLLVHNFHPELWPAGDPSSIDAEGKLLDKQQAYFDIDAAPSKTYMIDHSEEYSRLFNAAVAKRPEFELFNLSNDVECLNNVADDPHYQDIFIRMKDMLQAELEATDDPRIGSNPEIWESYPRLEGPMRQFPFDKSCK